MATVTTPLGYAGASGQIGHSITFRHTLSGTVAGEYTRPRYSRTAVQDENRTAFSIAVRLADYFLSFPDYKTALEAYCCQKRITARMGPREWLIGELLRNVVSADEPPRPPQP